MFDCSTLYLYCYALPAIITVFCVGILILVPEVFRVARDLLGLVFKMLRTQH